MEFTFENIIEKTVLVGMTYLDNDGAELSKVQFHGIISRAGETEGIVIIKADSHDEFILPPDLRSFQAAPLGEYRLRSTGEIVINPDLLTTWIVEKP